MTCMTDHHREIAWKENEWPVRYFIHIKGIHGNCWKFKEPGRRIIFDFLERARFWVSPSCPLRGQDVVVARPPVSKLGEMRSPGTTWSLICVQKKTAHGQRTGNPYFRKPVRLETSAKGLHPGSNYTPLLQGQVKLVQILGPTCGPCPRGHPAGVWSAQD